MLEKLALVVFGAILAGVGYLAKRWFERKPTFENLDVQIKLLSINKQMKEQGLTSEDLAKLQSALTGKAQAVEKHIQELEKFFKPLLEKSEGVFLSQAEMNIRASNNLDVAKLKMNHVLDELKALLDGPERTALLNAQTAWESYCVEQAESAAISSRGGSIYPLLYLSEIERLTVDRTAHLQADLDELRRLRS